MTYRHMGSVAIPHSRDDARTVVKAALEDSDGIKTYHDNGTQITGKTGVSLGLITSSYGEQVIVEIPDRQPSRNETMVMIEGKKEVDINIGANPEKYVSQVVENINNIKNNDINVIFEVLQENNIEQETKEVTDPQQQADGQWLMIAVVSLVAFFMFIILIL